MWDVISTLIITQTEKTYCNKQKGCHECEAVNMDQPDLDSMLIGMLIMVNKCVVSPYTSVSMDIFQAALFC